MPLNVCSIKNNNDTIELPITVLDWKENQDSKPAIRDVPTATQHIDSGTYLMRIRDASIILRLTDEEKDIFNVIYAESKPVNIYLKPSSGLTGWRFTVLMREKNSIMNTVKTVII
jgi:hypothetical protein